MANAIDATSTPVLVVMIVLILVTMVVLIWIIYYCYKERCNKQRVEVHLAVPLAQQPQQPQTSNKHAKSKAKVAGKLVAGGGEAEEKVERSDSKHSLKTKRTVNTTSKKTKHKPAKAASKTKLVTGKSKLGGGKSASDALALKHASQLKAPSPKSGEEMPAVTSASALDHVHSLHTPSGRPIAIRTRYEP